jgi:nucleoside-diphosphate-sugar epimerase
MAASAVKNRKVPVYGKDATRDFMFIDDAVLAITTAAARINDFTVCNLCTGYETKMHYIAELIACRYGAEVQLHEPRDWDTVSRRSGDPAKMVSIWPELELGRRIGFVGRLEKTLDWLEQEHFKGGRRDLVREDAVYRSAHG